MVVVVVVVLLVEGAGLLALLERVGLLVWAKQRPVALRRTAAAAIDLRVIFMGSFVLGLLCVIRMTGQCEELPGRRSTPFTK